MWLLFTSEKKPVVQQNANNSSRLLKFTQFADDTTTIYRGFNLDIVKETVENEIKKF